MYFADVDSKNGSLLSADIYDSNIWSESSQVSDVTEKELDEYEADSLNHIKNIIGENINLKCKKQYAASKGESISTIFVDKEGHFYEIESSYPLKNVVSYKYYENEVELNNKTKDNIIVLF